MAFYLNNLISLCTELICVSVYGETVNIILYLKWNIHQMPITCILKYNYFKNKYSLLSI